MIQNANWKKIRYLACPASPWYYPKDPLLTIRINDEEIFNILNLAKTLNQNIEIYVLR